MSGTYLVTTYQDKDLVKSLGARWDPARKQWYVPPGREIEPFVPWLPTGTAVAEAAVSLAPVPLVSSTELAVLKKGIPLSKLLSGVAAAITEAFKGGVWTIVEVVDTRVRGGHVYLEVSERDVRGVITAKSNAVIWSAQANRILPEFQQATGAELGPGIKLLVRARPVFKAQYGFTLEIDAIDSDYTLGDLEARKREIRERLQREGLFELNRQLPSPWDFNHVLVVAPEDGAGLGDFQAEASRLESCGVCRFIYAFSRFQGEGAAGEIRTALTASLEQIALNHAWLPDAIVIIRGGGAVNDMAWLNDYDLVRCVSELGIPVLTGIGHERDNTVLDEVANIRFDTPSKVIAGIEQTVVARVREAKASFDYISQTATRKIDLARHSVTQAYSAVESGARQKVSHAWQVTAALWSELKLQSAYSVRSATETSRNLMSEVTYLAQHHLALAKREVPALMAEIRAEAGRSVRAAKSETESEWRYLSQRVSADLQSQRDAVERLIVETVSQAHQTVTNARSLSQALVREVAGQGPDRTLSRGFALVRDAQGKTVTTVSSTEIEVKIQFRDGQRAAILKDIEP